MNSDMNTDTNPVNRKQREALLRAARRNHLIRTAAERSPKTRGAYAAALFALWRELFPNR